MNHFILSLCLGALLLSAPAYAEDLYVGQALAGGNTGADCANQKAITFFNSGVNWGAGAGKISPGDTVHLCGTITTSPKAQGSGSVGLPITIVFETGAKISEPFCEASWGCLYIGALSYIIVDGGTNGIIESTANGTGLANQTSVMGIRADACSNCEIKNLTIQNMYIHTADLTDITVDYSLVNAIKFSGSNTTVHDNTIHDAGWAIYQQYGNGDTTTEVHHNTIYNSSHGWTVAGSGAITATGFKFYNNHVYNYSNWDTTANAYHHDGIHAFGISGAVGTEYDIYNNLFDGVCGNHMTAHIFMEGNTGTEWTLTGTARIYNNVFICSGNIVNGILRPDIGNVSVYNNTIIGNGDATAICVTFASSAIALFKNNAMSGCGTNLTLGATATVTNHATGLNYNQYVCSGSANCFNWTGTQAFTGSIATWRTGCGCDANSADNADLLVNGSGVPQVGSPVINTGTDLSGLGITALNSDYLGISRPSGTIWDIGAYVFVSGGASRSPASARTQATARTIR